MQKKLIDRTAKGNCFHFENFNRTSAKIYTSVNFRLICSFRLIRTKNI